jgi:hypothetical protein
LSGIYTHTYHTYPSDTVTLRDSLILDSLGAFINYSGVSFSHNSLNLTAPTLAGSVENINPQFIGSGAIYNTKIPLSIVFNNITF